MWNPKKRANEMCVVSSGEIPIDQNVKGPIKNDGAKKWNTHVENNGVSAAKKK